MVAVGTDTYGKVKKVGTTPIVTRFAMLNALPIFPLESYYYAGPGQTDLAGIPLVLSDQTKTIRGLPLARIDKFSAVMAYFRGLCGAFVVVGFTRHVTTGF